MTDLTLRPYQERAVQTIKAALNAKDNALWIRRAHELNNLVRVTHDESGRYPVVKKVEVR